MLVTLVLSQNLWLCLAWQIWLFKASSCQWSPKHTMLMHGFGTRLRTRSDRKEESSFPEHLKGTKVFWHYPISCLLAYNPSLETQLSIFCSNRMHCSKELCSKYKKYCDYYDYMRLLPFANMCWLFIAWDECFVIFQ